MYAVIIYHLIWHYLFLSRLYIIVYINYISITYTKIIKYAINVADICSHLAVFFLD